MADFIFKVSPNIILSSYGVARLGQYAKEYGSKFIIVLDPILKEVAIAEKITQSLSDRKIDFFIFDELEDGATTQVAERALRLAKEGHVHGVIACGGAKAMHIGQIVAALYNENHDFYDYVDGAVPTSGAISCICVPTTMREIFMYTDLAPIVDARSNQLRFLKLQKSVCKLSLIDPNLLSMLSENQKISMAMEVMALASEAYLSQKANFFSDMLAEKSIELMSYSLDGSPSLEITTPAEVLLSQGGCMASLAIASSAPGACSLLAMAINARFKISLSLVTSILFPYFIEDAGAYKTSRIEKLANVFRVSTEEISGQEAVNAFAENIRIRMAKENLPVRLKELAIPIDNLALAVEDVGSLPLMSSLSRSMTSDDLFALVKAAY